MLHKETFPMFFNYQKHVGELLSTFIQYKHKLHQCVDP